MKCIGLISSCCPRNPHGKAGNEKRKRRMSVTFLKLPLQFDICVSSVSTLSLFRYVYVVRNTVYHSKVNLRKNQLLMLLLCLTDSCFALKDIALSGSFTWQDNFVLFRLCDFFSSLLHGLIVISALLFVVLAAIFYIMLHYVYHLFYLYFLYHLKFKW